MKRLAEILHGTETVAAEPPRPGVELSLEGERAMTRQCEFPGCEHPVNTVIHGHGFCGNPQHRSHQAEVPIVTCAIDGCGSPAAAASRWCAHHQPYAQRRAA